MKKLCGVCLSLPGLARSPPFYPFFCRRWPSWSTRGCKPSVLVILFFKETGEKLASQNKFIWNWARPGDRSVLSLSLPFLQKWNNFTQDERKPRGATHVAQLWGKRSVSAWASLAPLGARLEHGSPRWDSWDNLNSVERICFRFSWHGSDPQAFLVISKFEGFGMWWHLLDWPAKYPERCCAQKKYK